jgi:two-component system sensor histidine kinase BarA
MSHELRTPMNGIIGMTQALRESDKIIGEERDQLNTIYRSADSLLIILNDLLNFSKIEARKIDIENITFEIRDLIEDISDLMSTLVADKGIEIISEVENDVPNSLHLTIMKFQSKFSELCPAITSGLSCNASSVRSIFTSLFPFSASLNI